MTSERDGIREISEGFYFNNKDGDLGFYGLYDVKNGRAYVTYSGG